MKSKTSLLSVLIVIAMAAAFVAVFFKPQSESGNTSATSPKAAIADVESVKTPADSELPEGIRLVGVEKLWSNPAEFAGEIAIEGYVSQSFPDRGAFVMADTKEGNCCPEAGCAEFTVPAKVPSDEFAGELPKAMETVIAIGTISPLEKGFDFAISEVRRGGEVILKRKSESA